MGQPGVSTMNHSTTDEDGQERKLTDSEREVQKQIDEEYGLNTVPADPNDTQSQTDPNTNVNTKTSVNIDKSKDGDGDDQQKSTATDTPKEKSGGVPDASDKGTTKNKGPNHKSKPGKKPGIRMSDGCSTVVIFGLHPRVAAINMEKLLRKFGTIKRLDLKSALTSRYCFCEYHSTAHAQSAMDTLNGRMLLGKMLIVKPANDKSDGDKSQDQKQNGSSVVTIGKIEKQIQNVRQKIGPSATSKQDAD